MKLAHLNKEVVYQENNPAIKVLLETDHIKEIRLVFTENQTMKAHKTAFPITVNVVKGSIEFGLEKENITLEEGDIIALEANVLHDLKATSPSIVRLSLNKAAK